jgi:hypothetical protein
MDLGNRPLRCGPYHFIYGLNQGFTIFAIPQVFKVTCFEYPVEKSQLSALKKDMLTKAYLGID